MDCRAISLNKVGSIGFVSSSYWHSAFHRPTQEILTRKLRSIISRCRWLCVKLLLPHHHRSMIPATRAPSSKNSSRWLHRPNEDVPHKSWWWCTTATAACSKVCIVVARATGDLPDMTIDQAGDRSQQSEHWAHSWGNAKVSSQSTGLAPLSFKARHSGPRCNGPSGPWRGPTDRWHAGWEVSNHENRTETQRWLMVSLQGTGAGAHSSGAWPIRAQQKKIYPSTKQNPTRSAWTAWVTQIKNKELYKVEKVQTYHLPTKLGNVSMHSWQEKQCHDQGAGSGRTY